MIYKLNYYLSNFEKTKEQAPILVLLILLSNIGITEHRHVSERAHIWPENPKFCDTNILTSLVIVLAEPKSALALLLARIWFQHRNSSSKNLQIIDNLKHVFL